MEKKSKVQFYQRGCYQRKYPINLESWKSEFQEDLGRLVHSPSFRRLQGKTQLFRLGESDYFRNRLTHSLEVAGIAKWIALKLNSENKEYQIDPDLVEPQLCEKSGDFL